MSQRILKIKDKSTNTKEPFSFLDLFNFGLPKKKVNKKKPNVQINDIQVDINLVNIAELKSITIDGVKYNFDIKIKIEKDEQED